MNKMYSENFGSNRPLGELEMQQAANMQLLLNGALLAASYLRPGETLDDLDINQVIRDAQINRADEY